MGKALQSSPASTGVSLPEAIRVWRQATGRTLVDLAEECRLGLGHCLLAAKGARVPSWVEKRIREWVSR